MSAGHAPAQLPPSAKRPLNLVPTGVAGEVDMYIVNAIGMFGVTTDDILNELAQVPNGTTQLNVLIDSPGGEVLQGLAIYNALRLFSANRNIEVVVRVIGEASSMGSVIAMAGDRIQIAATAYMQIHKPWAMTYGNADQLRVTANELDKLTTTLAQIYATQTGMTVEDMQGLFPSDDSLLMLNAEECVKYGFADEIINPVAVVQNLFEQSKARKTPYNLDPNPRPTMATLPQDVLAAYDLPADASPRELLAARATEQAQLNAAIAKAQDEARAEVLDKLVADGLLAVPQAHAQLFESLRADRWQAALGLLKAPTAVQGKVYNGTSPVGNPAGTPSGLSRADLKVMAATPEGRARVCDILKQHNGWLPETIAPVA